ncbi:putative membrane protein [Tolypocladium ophioglossoides CBS 100239]|uniref:Putative membrane protein n=1 Tax=Tolypocladium ophioglossoides (strain CBS 100239) TaxID=1163406 RepID=A0A0L0N495_TOLOC|nr:putative membrane protein [Tolypocladium ophioglossoides CBS 100239]
MADPQPPPKPSIPRRILAELGLTTLYRSPRDIKLLCLQRFVRLFAYGSSTLILVSFLQALGHSRAQSGLFMTLTLAGDVCISFLLTLVADAVGRKAILAVGAALMAASGIVFACASNYWVLLAAAVLGVISPSGNEIGPFRAVEESVVAHLTDKAERGDVYAWYSLVGTAGTACGMMVCGWAINALRANLGWSLLEAYRATFVGYAVLGLAKLMLALALSRAVKADRKPPEAPTTETTPLLGEDQDAATPTKKKAKRWTALLPEISAESKGITATLCILFALDSFASGLAPLDRSWVTFFFRDRYGLEEGRLGSVFFTTSIISAASVIVASSLAKRLGNVKTMVFTHLPSAIFLALIPVPQSLPFSLLFLILRACTQSMDVAPRSAFLAAVLLPAERTAVMGAVNVVKTTAQSLGPLITGVLASHSLFWVSFVCAGSLKASYDLGLLAVFKNHERDREAGERADEEAQGQR